jgi:hypothetical protein
MKKYKLSALMSGLILIALFGVGCGPGISDKNRKILNDEISFKDITDPAEKNAKKQAVFHALVDVITVDFDTRKVAEGAEKARFSVKKLEKVPTPTEEAKYKDTLAKIAAMPDQELREKVKKALEHNENNITNDFSQLEMPKNVLVVLESLNDINSILPQAKSKMSAFVDVIKLLQGKLTHITDAKEQDEMIEPINKFILKLDNIIVDALNP